MIRKILIVAPFVTLPGEPYFNRFLYLARMWARDYDVTLVTSSFCHPLKKQRDKGDARLRELPFELVLLDEPGYRKNVCLARVTSHHRFVTAFRKWLAEREKSWSFDVVYSAYPLIATNTALAELRRRVEFKLVVDVQDVWPESISSAIPFLGRFQGLLWPFTRKADRAYAAADGHVAVSATYLARARRACPGTPGMVAYLGSDRGIVDAVAPAPREGRGTLLLYIGTISHSYDVATVVKGVSLLRETHPDLELYVLGDGPHRDQIEKLAGEGVRFLGLLPFDEMVAIAKSCDAAVNPIVKAAAQSVTNKLSDYFTLGLPIISSQRNEEVVDLVRSAGGVQYEAGNVASFCEAVTAFLGGSDLSAVRRRTEAIGLELFDRSRTYPRITAFLESLA